MTDVVWKSGVDNGAYEVQVVRVAEYQGVLTVTRASDNTELLNEEVGLQYDSLFGPDVDDLRSWQERALEVIDADINSRKETS